MRPIDKKGSVPVSIIIPCYNGERWIVRCLASILEQDFEEYEILFVNDGSTDRSSEILERLKLTDNRIKVLNKENGGVSSARNMGIAHAEGEWITFLDIDDRLLPNALSELVKLIEKDKDIDVIFAGYKKIGGKVLIQPKTKLTKVDNTTLAKELFSPNDYPYLGYPWAKLYRKSIIERFNLKFNEAIFYNEDRLFNLLFLSHIKLGIYTTLPVYEYNMNEGSAMSQINGPLYWKVETDLDAFIEMNDFIFRFNSNELNQLLYSSLFFSYQWNKRLILKYDNYPEKSLRRIKIKMKSVLPRPLYLKFKYKIMKNNMKRILLFILRKK